MVSILQNDFVCAQKPPLEWINSVVQLMREVIERSNEW
jgi:hypothetical protein